jgi:hypothetical protein
MRETLTLQDSNPDFRLTVSGVIAFLLDLILQLSLILKQTKDLVAVAKFIKGIANGSCIRILSNFCGRKGCGLFQGMIFYAWPKKE